MNEAHTDITQMLETLARGQPAAPALHVPGRSSLRYADLGEQIRYVRERLGNWNIARGDIVVGVIPLRPEMALACAALPAQSTFVPLSPAFATDVYVELMRRLRPKALLLPKGLSHPARLAAQRCAVTEIALVDDPCVPAGMFTLELAREGESPIRARPGQSDWAYLLATSGTTERPKLVPISHHRVALTAQDQGDWLRMSPNDIGCHLVPMHHGHGLNAALTVPLLRGSSVVCLPESDIEGFFSALDEHEITWLTAVFTIHREILRRAPDFPQRVAINKLRFMRVGSGRLETDEISAIERTFGVPVLTRYGMTEAYSITHSPLPPLRRKQGSVGVALCSEVAIMSEVKSICSAGDVGEIVVRGPQVFDGYFDDPRATADAFVDGWFRTGDLGYIDADGYLFLRGRIKDIINRGGEKISPTEIDATIVAMPGVRAAAAFAIPHQSLGEEVAVAVVKNGDVAITAEDIVDHVRRRLGGKWVPRRVYFVDQLPRTDSGKIRRADLPRLLVRDEIDAGAPSRPALPVSAPMSALEAALAGLWSDILQVGCAGVNDDFFLMGGDSLRGARLLTNVKAVFAVDLPLESLFRNASTIAGMARAIEAARLQARGESCMNETEYPAISSG